MYSASKTDGFTLQNPKVNPLKSLSNTGGPPGRHGKANPGPRKLIVMSGSQKDREATIENIYRQIPTVVATTKDNDKWAGSYDLIKHIREGRTPPNAEFIQDYQQVSKVNRQKAMAFKLQHFSTKILELLEEDI